MSEGFYEGARNKAGIGNRKFFNLGPENKWEKLVDRNITDEIEQKFKNEMKELGYI